ncbi:MAG TPA: amidohydrolase family protein [Acidimicrobiales bacterium]|nr:amidohydrolase family protein [Acidimicrobiales bacterium]
MTDEPEVLDSHCHAWRRWPYPPLVPDEDSRGTIDQLLYEMDLNNVREAAVVCAAIDNNPENVAYVSFAGERYPGRFHIVADLDCTWSATYHRPGAAARLRAIADQYPLAGFTHYVREDNDGWLVSEEAEAVFAVAEQRGLFLSLAAGPAWQADLRAMARRHPSVPVLCHHLAGLRTPAALGGNGGATSAYLEALAEVTASAGVENVYVKVSGFYYASASGWDYPWEEAAVIFQRLFEVFGPGRLCWGSDFPASDRYCTYRQSLEVVRSHCSFLSPDDRRLVLGGTLRSILQAGGAKPGWRT